MTEGLIIRARRVAVALVRVHVRVHACTRVCARVCECLHVQGAHVDMLYARTLRLHNCRGLTELQVSFESWEGTAASAHQADILSLLCSSSFLLAHEPIALKEEIRVRGNVFLRRYSKAARESPLDVCLSSARFAGCERNRASVPNTARFSRSSASGSFVGCCTSRFGRLRASDCVTCRGRGERSPCSFARSRRSMKYFLACRAARSFLADDGLRLGNSERRSRNAAKCLADPESHAPKFGDRPGVIATARDQIIAVPSGIARASGNQQMLINDVSKIPVTNRIMSTALSARLLFVQIFVFIFCDYRRLNFRNVYFRFNVIRITWNTFSQRKCRKVP